MSDLRRYRVTATQPYSWEIWAKDEEDARRQGIDKWRQREPAQVGGFPHDFEVEEINVKESLNERDV